MKRSGIYSITNLVNGHRYVGSAVWLVRRWQRHRFDLDHNKHDNQHLQNAWNKYGQNQFAFEVLEYAAVADLVTIEQYYIDWMEPEYNICPVAGNTMGRICRDETRIKLSLSNSGANNAWFGKKGPEHPHFGHQMSDEAKRAISRAQMGSGNSMFGRKHTEETHQHFSRTRTGSGNPMFGKTGTNNPNFGQKRSAEQKARISEGVRNALRKRFEGHKT